MIEVVRDGGGGVYRLKDPLSGKIISRPADKMKPAVHCSEFYVGNCISNDDITDDESSTQVQDKANDDTDIEIHSDSDTDGNGEETDPKVIKSTSALWLVKKILLYNVYIFKLYSLRY